MTQTVPASRRAATSAPFSMSFVHTDAHKPHAGIVGARDRVVDFPVFQHRHDRTELLFVTSRESSAISATIVGARKYPGRLSV